MATIHYFTVTEEHIKLLRNAYVGWDDCEYGAPQINPKRPYGNSDVEEDVAELLGIKAEGHEWGEKLSTKQSRYCRAIHEETRKALQIFLSTGEMKAGKYMLEGYSNKWKLAE